MRFCKLRTAWSVTWGTLCVLMAVLWVRSYFAQDTVFISYQSRQITIDTFHGVCYVISDKQIQGSPFHLYHSVENDKPLKGKFFPTHAGVHLPGVVYNSDVTLSFLMPYWFCITGVVVAATVAWIPWSKRFSLRTLLIATTLVAVALGFVVWVSRLAQ